VTTAVLRAAPLRPWEDFDERARAEEAAYISAALAQFAFEAADIERIFRRLAAGDVFVAEAVRRILADYTPGGRYHAQWLARYVTLIARTVRLGGQHVAGQVGVRFDLANPRVQAIIRRRAGALVVNVTDTTRALIRASVAQGRDAGLGTREIARLIRETTFGEITQTRAVTIARTETVGAMNAGEYASALQSGVLRSKTWLSQGDGRVRDSHRAVNGETVDIRAAFSNGLQHPHAEGAPAREVVNCRCTVLYSHEEAA
jgi:hypothetical protein